MKNKDLILELIRKEKLAVVSTINKDGKPQSAVVEFSETDKLEIIFDTFCTSRKYKNLLNKKDVSIVIGWDDDITVQCDGVAKELSGKELEEAKKIHVKKLPGSAKFTTMSDIRFFKIVPKWIRYSDLSVNPWEVSEIKF